MPIAISPEEFFGAFVYAWNKMCSDTGVPLEDLYVSDRTWTPVMCGGSASGGAPASLLELTVANLRDRYPGLAYDRERHGVDAFARIPRPPGKGEPSRHLDYLNVAMIEVENKVQRSNEEFWKLIHSRVPLKVLITYDDGKESRVASMLGEFSSMHAWAVDALGSDSTSYLVIFGGRDNDTKIRWRGYKLSHAAFTPLAG